MTFPPLGPSNPLPGFRFAVTFAESTDVSGAGSGAGVRQISAGFQEVTGLESKLEIHEYKEGGRNDFTHKHVTQANFGNITLKRGVATTPDLWTWYDQVRQGSFGARRSLLIAQLDYDGSAALVWYVLRALPAKYTGPGWNAGQSSVAIESIEIAHEGLQLLPAVEFGLQGA